MSDTTDMDIDNEVHPGAMTTSGIKRKADGDPEESRPARRIKASKKHALATRLPKFPASSSFQRPCLG